MKDKVDEEKKNKREAKEKRREIAAKQRGRLIH